MDRLERVFQLTEGGEHLDHEPLKILLSIFSWPARCKFL